MASKSGRMSISLEPEKQEKPDVIASYHGRSRNWIVNEAIEQYIETQEWQINRINERLKHSRSNKAKFFSSEEMDKFVKSYQVTSY